MDNQIAWQTSYRKAVEEILKQNSEQPEISDGLHQDIARRDTGQPRIGDYRAEKACKDCGG